MVRTYSKGTGLRLSSYLGDTNTQGWWKCDELIDGTDIVDYSGNGYDLTNTGMEEENVNSVFGYGIGADGITANCTIALTTAINLQIANNLTTEFFFYPEDEAKVGTGVYLGCMDNGQTVGWQLYSLNGSMHLDIRTATGLYNCNVTHAAVGYVNNKRYFIRVIYDGSEMAIWLQNLTDEGSLIKVASNALITGNIIYNTVTYDWFTIAGNNGGASNHVKGTFDQIVISDIIRIADFYVNQNFLPKETERVNIGSRLHQYDNIHVKNVFADYIEGTVAAFPDFVLANDGSLTLTESGGFAFR